MKKLILLILTFLVGCSSPVFKKMEKPTVPTTVRGHGNEIKETP